MRSGVNLGPVRLVKDLNGQMNIIGDGINVAQRVMSFSRPGQLLVSRSFYEVVSCLSRDYANLFHHEGSRTDKHVREHEVYSVVGGTPTARRVPETESKFSALAYGSGLLAGPGPLGLRRSSLAAASALFGLLIGIGVTARAVMGPGAEAPAEKPAAAAPKAAPPAPKMASAPVAGPGAQARGAEGGCRGRPEGAGRKTGGRQGREEGSQARRGRRRAAERARRPGGAGGAGQDRAGGQSRGAKCSWTAGAAG